MATRKYQTRKTFHLEVGKQLLLLDVYVANSHNRENSLTNGKKPQSKKYCDWFKEEHMIELLKGLKGIVVGKMNSTQQITNESRDSEDSHSVTTQNLKFNYCFKKRRVLVKQYALRRNPAKIFYQLDRKARKNEQINYECLPYFHEKLVVNVWQHATNVEQQVTNVQPLNKVFKEKEVNIGKQQCTASTSSDYFTEQTDIGPTSSVKRKKASLKNIAKKSKIALLKSPHEQSDSSTDSIANCVDDKLVSQIICTTLNSSNTPSEETTSKPHEEAIDLDQEPEGLIGIKNVENLRLDQLKFLIYKMEEYLRTIFRGEVYCRRHEDYKRGGKARDNLNFQVGMAHFNEDQHDCIMDTLMAMFCYNNNNILRYMDYVTKVMLPEALIKLFQDVHKTSFDQAEECLLNDTIM